MDRQLKYTGKYPENSGTDGLAEDTVLANAVAMRHIFWEFLSITDGLQLTGASGRYLFEGPVDAGSLRKDLNGAPVPRCLR